jgi:hypothetical protein
MAALLVLGLVFSSLEPGKLLQINGLTCTFLQAVDPGR